jgi:hypothetical protein
MAKFKAPKHAISQFNAEIQKPGNGVYIELFHGRTPKDKELDDWGSNGPLFGPYTCIQQTYMATIRMIKANGDEDMLWVVDDLVYYNGVYYGDFTIYSEAYIATQSRKPVPFEERKADRKPEDKAVSPELNQPTEYIATLQVTDPSGKDLGEMEIRQFASGVLVGLDGTFLETENLVRNPYGPGTLLIPDDEAPT